MRLLVTLALLSVAGGIRVPIWPTKTDKDTQKSAETHFATYPPHGQVNYENKHLGSASQPISGTKYNLKKHLNGTPYFKPKNLDSYRIPKPTHPRNILTKNYRDDTTHETKDLHRENIGSNEDLRQKLIENGVEKSEHSLPKDIPTKPNYPGLGEWAKKGVEKNPLITNHKFTTLEETNPEGVEIYHENEENIFNKQFAKFKNDFSPHIPIKDEKLEQSQSTQANIKEENEETQENIREEENEETQEDDEEFVPTKTYSQVRAHETEEHLPSDPDEPRLREVVIDKTTRVVYTEEGYEDSAYDHAGHEKKAENSEGDSDYENGNKKSPSERIRTRKNRIKAEELDASRIVEEQLEKDEDSEPAGSTHESIKKTKVPRPTKKFSKTQEVKLAEMKKTPNGKVEMEISTEIKVLSSPNNKTTAHKYVKIVPKHPQKIRRKRYVLDLPNIEIDTDFIDKLNKNPEPLQEHEDLNKKYPYYHKNLANINEHSPLKYAENLANVPEKIEGQMSFYQHAEKKVCPEVETDIDPIPEHVKNKSENGEQGEEEEEEGNGDKNVKQPELPRLKNLGDKIDCFKAKYFGENPLDSPFFSEDLVSPPKPIFHQNIPKVANGNQIQPSYTKEVRRPQRNSQEISNDSPKIKTNNGDPIVLHEKRTHSREKLEEGNGNNETDENQYEFIPLELSGQKSSSSEDKSNLYDYDYDYDKDTFVHYKDQESSESSEDVKTENRYNIQNEPGINEESGKEKEQVGQKNNSESKQEKGNYYSYEPYKLEDYKTEFGKFANGVINEFLQKNLTSNEAEEDNDQPPGFIINTENYDNDYENEKNLQREDTEEEEELEKVKELLADEKTETENTAEEDASKEQPKEPFIIYTTTEETDDGNKTLQIELKEYDSKEKLEENFGRNDTAEVKVENIDNHETFSTEYPFIINLDTFGASRNEQQENEKNTTQDIETTATPNLPKSINDIIVPKKVENQEKKLPKSIYDQIKLLENEEEVEEIEKVVTTTEASIDASKNEQINNRLERMFKMSPGRMPKVSDVILHTPSRDGDSVEEEFEELDDIPNKPSTLSVEGEESPEAEALRRKRKRKKRPFYRPNLHASVFDISRFIPKANTITPLLGLPSHVQTSIVPKYKPISEVHYKDEIKPSEQLNVFADVINIIKNSSRDLQSESSSEIVQYSEPISVQINTSTKKVNTRRIKIPINRNKNKIRTNISHTFIPNTDVTSFQEQERHYPTPSPTTTTTTEEPVEYINIRGKIKRRRPNISNEQLYREFLNKLREHQNDQTNHQKLNNIFKHNQQETEQIFHRTHQNLLNSSSKKRPEFEQNIGEASDVAHEVKVVKATKNRPQLFHPYKRIVEAQDDKNPQIESYEEVENQPPNEEVLGLIPPKTTYTNYDSIYLTKKRLENSNPNHKGPHHRMNVYPVQGMLPPSQDTPILYSDFQILPIKSNSLIKRNTHRISKRSPTKPSYSEIRRNPNRPSKPETPEKEEDDDDYVPHRPQNFHYDEAKGKIVYDRKPAYEKEEPEYIEVEVYDEEPIPKDIRAKKPKTTTTPPPPLIDFSIDRRNEFNYLDFVKKLKSDPNYQEIEDPKPTEKSASTTTTPKPTTSSGPQKLPEFLSILSKVKQDSSYEAIEDKKEDKATKKKTTTPAPELAIESEEEEEPLGDIQNSRGGEVFSGESFESYESHEDSPKVKNYSPRTTIDTSKYKSIERPSVNHKEEQSEESSVSRIESDSLENAQKSYLISRQESEEDLRRNEFINRHNNEQQSTFSEDDEDALEEDRRRNEFLARQEQRKRLQNQNIQDDSEEDSNRKSSPPRHSNTNNQKQEPKPNIIPKRRRPTTVRPETTSAEEKEEVTTKANVRLRQRKRPTTLRPRTTTSSEELSEEESSPPTRRPHPTAKRIYPRRQKVRIRTTKDPEFDNEEGTTPLPRKLIRRHQSIKDSASLQRIPTNHKEFYTPLVVIDRLEAQIDETMHVPARVITPDIIASAHDQAKIASKQEDAPAKITDDVEVFAKFDARAKHGGNYRRQNEKRNMRRYTTPRNEVESTSEAKSEDDEEERLTDVVPKPDSFYLDPKLPSTVNTLKDEVEEESKISESKNKEESEEKDDKDYDINDEVKVMVENKHPTTKKPIIIKDPSKRLYFYAPL